MTFARRAWMIFGIVIALIALLIVLGFLFLFPVSSSGTESDFGKVERVEEGS
jgi:hypothetical protein